MFWTSEKQKQGSIMVNIKRSRNHVEDRNKTIYQTPDGIRLLKETPIMNTK